MFYKHVQIVWWVIALSGTDFICSEQHKFSFQWFKIAFWVLIIIFYNLSQEKWAIQIFFWPVGHSTGRKVSRGWTAWALAAYLGVGARLRLKSFFVWPQVLFQIVCKQGCEIDGLCLPLDDLKSVLAMSKYRLKLSSNMDLRCPRHGTRAIFLWFVMHYILL